jgi:DnaJ-domain-containing protein 1
MRLDVDHYLVLGVPRTADAATIRAAYVGLAKKYHPDVASGNPELATFNFRQITAAYQTLSDPESRARYDARVQTALDAERARREQTARAAAAARAAKVAARAKSKDRLAAILFGKVWPLPAVPSAANPILTPTPPSSTPKSSARKSFLPLRPAPPPAAYLPHADAMARRRSILVVAVVLLTFIGVSGYLATRAVTGPGLEVMAAETARPVEARPPVKTKPKPVPPINQPSQLGASDLPPSAPIGGVAAGRSSTPKPAPVAITDGQSVCVADDGAKFAIINRGGEPTVIYNGAPPVRASVQFSDRHLVVLTNIVPSDTIMIGIQRGQENGTHVYYADARGAIVQTVGVRCEGQAY